MKRLWLGLRMWVMAGFLGCAINPGENGTDGSNDGPLSPIPTPPTLIHSRAQATGRLGHHLRLEATGTDANGDVTGLWVKLMRADGSESPYFDADWNGSAESAESVMPLDEPVEGQKEFTAVVTFPDLMMPPPAVFRVAVALLDREGNRSETKEVDVTFQALRSLGQSCDVAYIDDVCEAGLGCRGDPAVCREGVAPTVERGGYFRTPYGPRILLEGVDPDDDVSKVTVSFFDRNNQPVKIDLDNDGVNDSSLFEVDASNASNAGRYFVALQAAPTFEEYVERVSVEPVDAFERKGKSVSYGLSNPPGRGQGQQCDPRGFDACITHHTCSPGIVGAKNTCISSAFARTKKCEASPAIRGTLGLQTTKLKLEGASLWEPPSGCAANNPHSRPEGVVRLSLPQKANKLILSTARPGTTVDTIVTLLPGCSDAAMSKPIACIDDGFKTTASTLTLENVAAGEYLVVVDNWNPAGGLVELAIDIQ